jgi:transcriptional regulator with XRE-family HTH domain
LAKNKSPVSKRLKEARSEAGLSQKALGIKAGIDQFSASARMNQYETDKHVPDFGTVKRIAKVLKIPTSYFYCEDDQLAQLIMGWTRITKIKKEKLLSLLKYE